MRRTRFNILNVIGEWTKKHSNLPDRYIKRASEQVYWKTPRGPEYQRCIIQKDKFYFGLHRPWTFEFRKENWPGETREPNYVEPIKKWSWFLGDRVEILVGKDKGKQGTICQLIQERNWVIVEGLNTKLKTVGKTSKSPGMVIQEEQPLLVTTDISLVDPSDLGSTGFTWKSTEEGEEVRVSDRTGRIIPIPISAESTMDYKFKIQYVEGPKDTLKKDVLSVTFEPELKTFEMDIMDKMGIKEDRIEKPTYWY